MMVYGGRYRKIKELGSGVTGTVCLVQDEKTGLHCALKLLQSPLKYAKQSELEGFRHEFETLKELNHPSIAQVFDAGLIQEIKNLYIVTEFIEGRDLFEFTEGKSIAVVEELFVQALRALNYLHSKKVIHLDIKPQNILVAVSQNNEPLLKIIDFGYANFYKRRFSKSQKGTLLTVGTAPYTAPEVIQAESSESPPDYRADLYSLACTFYKALTREVPFPSGDLGEVYYRHLNEKPKPPSSMNPAIPDYLDKILLKLLEKNPADRHSSAQAVIEDLYLLSGKSYPVEILQTRLSYLPEKGKLIARQEEFKHFKDLYADRIYLEECQKKPYLIIKGKSGTGKTRFLQECKNEAQRHFVHILSWKELKSYKIGEKVAAPCLVLADDISFDSYDIEFVEAFFMDIPLLVLFATSKDEVLGEPDHIIELKNFTQSQTNEYLTVATNLPQIPQNILDIIFTHTHGNPLYLTEYIRACFEKGYLRDTHGSWSIEILEDLGNELETLGVSEFIKKRLKEKLESSQLKDHHFYLLYMLTLTGKPTLEDICEITGAFEIDKYLKFLVEQGILEIDSASHYSFSNSLFKEVLLEMIPQNIKEEICDNAANYWESQKAPREKILYYRGRGNSPKAASYLLELAQIKRSQNLHLQAKVNLLELMKKENTDPLLLDQARLELAEILIETGEYEEAERLLKQILSPISPQSTAQDPLLYAKAFEQLGLIYYLKHHLDKSTQAYNQGLDIVLKNKKSLRWMEVILRGRIAQNQFDLGRIDEAEKTLKETWSVWKNELGEEEKILATRNNIDTLYYAKGEYQKAIDCLEEHLKVLSKKPYLDSYPITIYKLGRAYLKINQPEKGEGLLKQCLELMKERHTSQWLYMVYNELGLLYERREDFSNSLFYYKHAFDLAKRQTNVEVNFYIIAKNVAQIYLKLNNLNEAEKYFNFAIRNLEQLQNKNEAMIQLGLYLCYLGLAEIDIRKSKFESAQTYLKKAFNLLESNTGLKSYSQDYWQGLADFYRLQGKTKESQEALKQLDALKGEPWFNKESYKNFLKNYSSQSA